MTDTPDALAVPDDGEVIDVLSKEDEAELAKLTARLHAEYPTIGSPGFDYSQLNGHLGDRTAKAIILQLTLRSHSVADIAAMLKMHPTKVGHYLAVAIQEATPFSDVELLRNLELARIRKYEQDVLEIAERAKRPVIKRTITTDPDGKETMSETQTGQAGSPACYTVLAMLSKLKAALCGLNAPKQVQVKQESTQRKVVEVVVKTPEEALEMRKQGLIK